MRKKANVFREKGGDGDEASDRKDSFAEPETIGLHEVNERPPTFRNKRDKRQGGKTAGGKRTKKATSSQRNSQKQMEALRARVLKQYKQLKKKQQPGRGFHCAL